MGNKPAILDMKGADMYKAEGRNLRALYSEEEYMPMPVTMRRALVEGRRFRHVKPSREDVVESARGRGSGAQMEELQRRESSGVLTTPTDGVSRSVRNTDDMFGHVDPIVTVLNVGAVQNKSKSKMNSPVSDSKIPFNYVNNTAENTKHLHKSPTLTNRRYSLIDMRTGLKKSKFTLELEDKLRQSKFNLGFDDDLNDWKEFSYSMENPDSGKRVESLKKGQLRFGLEGNVGKGLEKVCLRDPLQYCAHNCQILGLCSVRSPDVLPVKENPEPSALQDEISRKYKQVQSILKGDLEHHKKEECNCDHCMLAYLTEMGFPEDDRNSQCVSVRKCRSPKESPRSCRKRVTERIRIVENENTRKCIEISVSARPSAVNSEEQTVGVKSCESNMSDGTFCDEDTTNRRIKRMFKKNNAAVREVYNNHNENRDQLSVANVSSAEEIFKTSDCFNDRSEEVLQVQMNEIRRSPLSRNVVGNGRRPSSSTMTASVSSSLSSVLSYKRVRQIFQSIIERNRARRRPKKNINKFRELEELGLGEVKNNRWYPSDSKTLSIWHTMHQSVQGIQGEFRKYPRPY